MDCEGWFHILKEIARYIEGHWRTLKDIEEYWRILTGVVTVRARAIQREGTPVLRAALWSQRLAFYNTDTPLPKKVDQNEGVAIFLGAVNRFYYISERGSKVNSESCNMYWDAKGGSQSWFSVSRAGMLQFWFQNSEIVVSWLEIIPKQNPHPN